MKRFMLRCGMALAAVSLTIVPAAAAHAADSGAAAGWLGSPWTCDMETLPLVHQRGVDNGLLPPTLQYDRIATTAGVVCWSGGEPLSARDEDQIIVRTEIQLEWYDRAARAWTPLLPAPLSCEDMTTRTYHADSCVGQLTTEPGDPRTDGPLRARYEVFVRHPTGSTWVRSVPTEYQYSLVFST